MKKKTVKIENRRARYDYEILETLEAGLVLRGTEVKSIRQGKANLKEAYVYVLAGEVFLSGMHISPYEEGNRFNHEPLRERKLLLHKAEILKLDQAVQRKGLTIVPLKLYFVRGRAKVEIALARGKKIYDKRDSMQAKEVEQRMKARLGSLGKGER